MKTLLTLFYEFFMTGLFSIGGGLATLPFLYKIADKYPWFSADILPDMVAISESTPGPIGINMATYAGFNVGGLLGALLATVALVLPAFLIILFVSKPLHRVKDSKTAQSVLYTLRPAVMALIAAALWKVMEITLFDFSGLTPGAFSLSSLLECFRWQSIALFTLVYLLYRKSKRHPIWFIIGCAVLGIVFAL